MGDITIGLLHPGEMGAAVGQCLARAGHRVLWAPAERSPASAARAGAAGLTAADGGVANLVRLADVVVSVCPPHAALDLARQVAESGFGGLYLDANAISPETAREAAAIVEAGGASYVDGGIIGTPPVKPGFIRLYLSGARAAEVRGLFEGTPVQTIVVDQSSQAAAAEAEAAEAEAAEAEAAEAEAAEAGTTKAEATKAEATKAGTTKARAADAKNGDAKNGDAKNGDAKNGDAKNGDAKNGDAENGDAENGSGSAIGLASAVKMAYASWTKGSAALLLAARALARAEGVEQALLAEWAISQPGLADRSADAARSAAAKGWRWIAEMEEIAATMTAAGLPEGFHQAAAEVYRRSPHDDGAAMDAVLAALPQLARPVRAEDPNEPGCVPGPAGPQQGPRRSVR